MLKGPLQFSLSLSIKNQPPESAFLILYDLSSTYMSCVNSLFFIPPLFPNML